MSEPLGYVAGEDRDEERREQQTHGSAPLGDQDHRRAEGDLDETGSQHRDVRWHRQPIGHLCLKLPAGVGQMADAGEHHERAQDDAADLLSGGFRVRRHEVSQ